MQTIDRRRFNTGLFLSFGLAGCAQLEPGMPDLVVTAIRWSEDDGATWHTGPIQAGSDVLFECDVLNQGTAPTPEGVIIGVGFILDGQYVAWSDTYTAALPAGQTISLRANGGPDGDRYWNNAQAGSYTIRAHVDDINRIPNELDETNNTLNVPVMVGPATGIQARQADAFVDSIGVNTHFMRNDYVSNYTSGANLKQKLADLGIRHIRDGTETGASGYAGRLVELYEDHGIKTTLITGWGAQQRPPAAYTWIQNNIGFEKIAAMEGLNEPAVFHGASAQQRAYDIQVELWNSFRVNGVAAAQAIPLFPCSPTSLEEADSHTTYGNARSPTWPEMCDGGNVHPYTGGRHPETPGWGGQFGDYNYGSLQFNMQSVAEEVAGPGVPILLGEHGYRYEQPWGGGGQPPVTEEVGGIYVPRMYLYCFATTLPSGSTSHRTFLYQLLDDSEEFKLVNTDGSVISAYTALQNLISLLADPGPPFTPSRLDYALSGSTSNVHHVLMQKRDGTFYIAVWLGRSIWNQDTQTPITVNPQSVTITFNQPIASVDQVYPNDGTTWNALTVSNDQVTLSVDPRVMLLRVVPLFTSSTVAAVS